MKAICAGRSPTRAVILSTLLAAVVLTGACGKKDAEEAGAIAETVVVEVPPAPKDSPQRLAYAAALKEAPESYAIQTSGGKHTFSNVAYGLVGEIADGKLTVRPSGGRSRWNLTVKPLRFGYGGEVRPVPAAAEARAVANHLEIKRGGLSESVVSGALGVRYGITFAAEPKGRQSDERLLVVLSLQGDLKASLAADARSIDFRDSTGEIALRARDLLAISGDKPLPSGITLAQQGEVFVALSTKEASFPLSVSLLLSPPSSLSSVDSGGDDGFGEAVACSGAVAVVGAPGKAAAYVHTRTSSGWKHQARLASKEAGSGTNFGAAVAVARSTVVVGAPLANPHKGGFRGAAFVYTPGAGAGSWSQAARLQASGASEMLGSSVAASDDVIALGAPGTSGSRTPGEVYVFAKNSKSEWAETARLDAADAQRFGRSLALSGGVLYAGSNNAVYAFTKKGDTWVQKAKIPSPDRDVDFGSALAATHDALYVGAPGKGVVYRFAGATGSWAQRGTIAPQRPLKDFGTSVATNGATLLVGAPAAVIGSAGAVGSVSVFGLKGQDWAETSQLVPVDPAGAEAFGKSVALSGESALVGTRLTAKCPPDCTPVVGRAYSFVRLPAHPDGHKCTDDSQCTSGSCADGVCCNAPCDGPCDACSAAAKRGGADGECGKAAAGTDPRSRCDAAPDFARECKADGMCDGEGKCRTVAGQGTLCAGPSCGGGELRRGTCDGATATCKVGFISCAPYTCANHGECRSSCLADSDCAHGFACASGACRKK